MLDDMLQSLLYILSITFIILYNIFFILNLAPIWHRDRYYFLFYFQLSICSFLVLFEAYIHFTFTNLLIFFLVFTIYPHSPYTMVALVFDIFLFLHLLMIILRRQEYQEISSGTVQANIDTNKDEYPPAIDMRTRRPEYQYLHV